jgi:energy-coupling factor transporter ATP-binding protein EcfA2
MGISQLKPNERYALVGKTRSGKTALAMVLAGTFAMALPDPWEVWWIDTKNDDKDLRALRKWGFRNAASEADRETSLVPNAIYWRVESHSDSGEDLSTIDQVGVILEMAYRRRNVLIVIDEYAQVVPSARNAGKPLLDVFQRGGGRDVGLIGLTQEPVFVPRQLLSQATHLVLLNLSFQRDIDYIKQFCPQYVKPASIGDTHGFYWSWVDGAADWTYYPHQRDWYNSLQVQIPNGGSDPSLVETS